MKISYAITVCNEHKEIEKLLTFLFEHKRREDQVVVQMDTKATKEVWNACEKFENRPFDEYKLVEHGLEKDLFRRFEKVISGHFHKKSDDGQIYYLGTQYEITWNDYNCPKGFHVFDTQTRELTRIPNPLRMFRKIFYDDHKEHYIEKDISEYDNTYLKLFVVNNAIFINSKKNYIRYKDRIGIKPFLMEVDKIKSFDVDWPEDFTIAENIYESINTKT